MIFNAFVLAPLQTVKAPAGSGELPRIHKCLDLAVASAVYLWPTGAIPQW